MTNKIKALSLAFIAVAAMSAVAASAAQGSALDLAKSPAVITGHSHAGTQTDLIVPLTAGGSLLAKCPTASFEGTYSGALTDITDLTVTAAYGPNAAGEPCKVNGLNATVKMNGCKYTITGGANTSKGVTQVDIVGCTATKQIEIEQTATGCIIFIPEAGNASLAQVLFDQFVGQTDATATASVNGITNTQGAKCPNPNHHQQNASLTGETTTQAFEDTKSITQDTIHGHQFNTIGHGQTQIAITVT